MNEVLSKITSKTRYLKSIHQKLFLILSTFCLHEVFDGAELQQTDEFRKVFTLI